MVFRRSTILLVLLPFVLAGCFRQASDSFDAVDDTNAEPQSVQENIQETLPSDLVTATPPPPTLALGGNDDEDDATNDLQPTESDADMDTDADTPEPDDNDNALPTLGNPVTSTPIVPPTTVPQVTSTNANTQFGDDDASPDVTPTFITPGAPTAIPGAASPTPPGDDAATPSGLVTPTDFLSGGNNNAGALPARCFYTVQPGDNLFRIAINNSTTLEQLRSANPQIRGDVIQPGDQLTLPIVGCEGGDTSPPTQPEEEPPQAGQPTTAPGQTTHTVSAGETLSVIARRYGTTITEIVQANNLTNPDRLSIGQQLIIPVGGN